MFSTISRLLQGSAKNFLAGRAQGLASFEEFSYCWRGFWVGGTKELSQWSKFDIFLYIDFTSLIWAQLVHEHVEAAMQPSLCKASLSPSFPSQNMSSVYHMYSPALLSLCSSCGLVERLKEAQDFSTTFLPTCCSQQISRTGGPLWSQAVVDIALGNMGRVLFESNVVEKRRDSGCVYLAMPG